MKRPAFPARGGSPEEQRLLSGVRDLVDQLFGSGEFIGRQIPERLLRGGSGVPVQLSWGKVNRVSLATDCPVFLPAIRPDRIGHALYFTKLTSTGTAFVYAPGGAALGAKVNGSPTGIRITDPGASLFISDNKDWYCVTPGDLSEARREPFDVWNFGARPSASPAVNLAAFMNAAAAAAPSGGTVWFHGSYPMVGGITAWPENVALQGDGDGSVLDFSGVVATTIGISVTGSQAAGVALAVNAAEGSDDLNVSGATFVTDGWVKVSSTAVTGSTNWPKGEICRLSDATTMTLYDPLCDSYATADTASVAALTLVSGVAFRNFRIVGPADNGVTFSGILLDRTIGASVENVTCERCHFYGVGFQDSIQWSISDSKFSKSETGALAYGLAIFNACQDFTSSNLRGYRLRHLITHGGFTTRNGVPRRGVHGDSVASQCRNSGFDVHAAAEDITFNNCTDLGSESDGFTIEGASVTCNACRVRDSVGPGFHLNPQSLKPFRVNLNGCDVSGKGNSASRSAIQIQVTAGYESFDGISINGGTFADCRYGLRTINAQTGRIENLSISGGTYTRCGLDGDAVLQVTHAQGVSISGVTIYDTTNSVDGVSLTDVLDFDVGFNTVRLPGTGGCRGVRCLTTTADGTIDNNTVSCGSSGIGVGLADTCANVTVGAANHLRGCPTPLSLGLGVGHRLIQGHAATLVGDTGKTLEHGSDYEQIWNTTLSNNRTVGIPTGNVRMGFRITRATGADGAFSLSVGSGVALHTLSGIGQWCDIVSYGSGFIKSAAGSY